MKKELGTYIGICDFMNRKQAIEMQEFFAQMVKGDLQLMIGTMTSYKVLKEQFTKWNNFFPKPETLAEIFSVKDQKIINCIHYADYGDNPSLSTILTKLVGFCGDELDAIQLDMIWPSSKELEFFKRKHDLPLVLQISSGAMRLKYCNPIEVATVIKTDYDGLISHVLLDCSMGRGIAIDIPLIEGYIEAIKVKTDIKIAVAGGLGPDSIYQVKDLIEKYQVSVDAQSNLRISGNAIDPIHWPWAKKYLTQALECYQ